jgi:signal transduction histidine kinase
MQVKAAYGWENSPSQIPIEPHSLESFLLGSQGPVLLDDVQQHVHSAFSNLLLQHQIASGICTVIPGAGQPYGMLAVFSSEKQTFTSEDIYFVQNIANLIALCIRNHHADGEWKIVQEDLRNKLEQLQNLTRHSWGTELEEVKSRMLESRERERLRLAQELHDVPIQDLYGLIYQLDDLKDFIQEEDGKTILDDFHHTINRIINTLRTMCGELRPPSLSPFGLEVAIRDHVEKFREQNPGIEIHMNLMRDQQVLSDSLRLSLFRIYQQAIANVARHANATEVFIRFRWDEEAIVLEIEDNGIGFELPQQWIEFVRQEHFGLMGVAERVESMHGRLEVISAPGSGTLIRAGVPCYTK